MTDIFLRANFNARDDSEFITSIPRLSKGNLTSGQVLGGKK